MANRAVTWDPSKPSGQRLAPAFKAELDPAIVTALADNDVVAEAAVEAVDDALSSANVATGEELDDDEFGVRFNDGDYFLRANETDGITSLVGGASFVTLPDEAGWAWVIMGEDRKAVAGQRLDGSSYGLYQPEAELATEVIFVGDSLSAMWSSYLGGLSTALERVSTTIGIGAQTSPQIAARQGGKPAQLTVSGNQIPASGPVSVTAWSINLLQLNSDGTRSIPGILCGVPGMLTAVRAAGPVYTYTFTRTSPGSAMPCPPLSPFQCGFEYRDKIQIICVGRNNINDTVQSIVDQVAAMIRFLGTDKYLVLSVPPKDTEIISPLHADRVKVDGFNTALRDNFGSHWCDWAGYFRSASTLQAVGLTPSATDLQNITDGVTPVSFRTDELHLNAKAYEAATLLLAQTIAARGW